MYILCIHILYVSYVYVGRQFLCERVFRTGMLFYEKYLKSNIRRIRICIIVIRRTNKL